MLRPRCTPLTIGTAHAMDSKTRQLVAMTGSLIVMGGALLLGCGSSEATTPTVSASPTVTSCTSVAYAGNTYSVQCSIPGQSQQPVGITIFAPAIAPVCLIVSCRAGCASTVTKGTASGSTCS